MPHNRTLLPLEGSNWVVQITDDDSRTLIEPKSGSGYHSASGAIAETLHVYLGNSGVGERLEQQQSTQLLEVGLGTGLAMLVTIDRAISGSCELKYVALENTLLQSRVLHALNLHEHVAQSDLVNQFLAWRETLGSHPDPGTYTWNVAKHICVDVILGDAQCWEWKPERRFDAVYFDPFAPSVNPELWKAEFLSRVRGTMENTGRLVTYCVNREVRDSFDEAGFVVTRVKGPVGGKREVMVATPQQTYPRRFMNSRIHAG